MRSSSSCLGLVRIGEYFFAVSSSELQRVIPRPVLTPLAVPGPLVTGTFRFGTSIVPSMDLASVFSGVAAPPQIRTLVAVLRHEDSLLGLEIDAIRKVVRPDESEFNRFVPAGDTTAEGQHSSPSGYGTRRWSAA